MLFIQLWKKKNEDVIIDTEAITEFDTIHTTTVTQQSQIQKRLFENMQSQLKNTGTILQLCMIFSFPNNNCPLIKNGCPEFMFDKANQRLNSIQVGYDCKLFNSASSSLLARISIIKILS